MPEPDDRLSLHQSAQDSPCARRYVALRSIPDLRNPVAFTIASATAVSPFFFTNCAVAATTPLLTVFGRSWHVRSSTHIFKSGTCGISGRVTILPHKPLFRTRSTLLFDGGKLHETSWSVLFYCCRGPALPGNDARQIPSGTRTE